MNPSSNPAGFNGFPNPPPQVNPPPQIFGNYASGAPNFAQYPLDTFDYGFGDFDYGDGDSAEAKRRRIARACDMVSSHLGPRKQDELIDTASVERRRSNATENNPALIASTTRQTAPLLSQRRSVRNRKAQSMSRVWRTDWAGWNTFYG